MQKAKKYDWKDTNLALIGSDLDKEVKKAAALTEPAWKNAGDKVGLQIWRIVKFKVEHWPRDDYGRFFNGDSYIILNTYKEDDSEELKYDVHFWIGQYSSQDEYATAAYKTVELDTFLDDKPIQHREVMGHESQMFLSYFSRIEILNGGADTGFNQVKPEEYVPRLLHFHGDKKNGVHVREVPFVKSSVDETDVMIFDYVNIIVNRDLTPKWLGAKSNKDEKFEAVKYTQVLKSDRCGRASCETIDQFDSEYNKLKASLPDTLETEEERSPSPDGFTKAMFKLSDASGELEYVEVGNGEIPANKLDSNDVFICDAKTELYVWIGTGASESERKNALPYAHSYLKGTSHPCVSVTCIKEGEPCRAASFFHKILD